MAVIEIKLLMECDDCGATLMHRKSQVIGKNVYVYVLPCANCKAVNGRKHAKEVAELQGKIERLQGSIAKAMGMKEEPKP
jgi:DNA-directed RNA polymerase subunit M/transcription elongation factor TFIIS